MNLDMNKYLQRLITEEECGNCPIDINHPDCVGKNGNKIMICRYTLDWLKMQESRIESLVYWE